MPSRKPLFRIIFLVLILLSVITYVFLFSTSSKSEAPVVANRSSNPYNTNLRDSAISLLHDGDLVLRLGSDMTSYMLSQLNQRTKAYSHCGIVFIEDGKPYIYHSIGGEDNPDQKIRRDSAAFWFSPANNLAIGIARFSLDDTELNTFREVIRQYYTDKRMFDMEFDLETDDRLYCAEMIYKGIDKAMDTHNFIKPINIFGLRCIDIDGLFLNDHTKLICQLRYK